MNCALKTAAEEAAAAAVSAEAAEAERAGAVGGGGGKGTKNFQLRKGTAMPWVAHHSGRTFLDPEEKQRRIAAMREKGGGTRRERGRKGVRRAEGCGRRRKGKR